MSLSDGPLPAIKLTAAIQVGPRTEGCRRKVPVRRALAGGDQTRGGATAFAWPQGPNTLARVAAVELSGVSVVGAGAFNPAIIHPQWLAAKGLVPERAASAAMESGGDEQLIVSNQLSAFTADWLTVQVTQEQAVFTTVEEGRELDLRDVAMGVFDLLPETPVDAVGINAAWHVRAQSEADWHAFGDRFLPKDFWHQVFDGGDWRRREDGEAVGLRTMTVEVGRPEGSRRDGIVKMEVAPSTRIVPGIFASVNAHFQLTLPEKARGSAYDAARTLEEEWEEARAQELTMLSRLFEAR